MIKKGTRKASLKPGVIVTIGYRSKPYFVVLSQVNHNVRLLNLITGEVELRTRESFMYWCVVVNL